MRTATLAIGYADGYSRALSCRGVVTFDGHALPVLGRVTMDQIVVDVSHVPAIRPGDVVLVYSDLASDPNSIERVASEMGTIPYEILTGLTKRLPRRHLNAEAAHAAAK